MPILKMLSADSMKENTEKDLEKLRALSRAQLTGTTPGGALTATILMRQMHTKL